MQGPSHDESNDTPSQQSQEQSQRLLELLTALEGELHPGGERRKIALDSSLEKDIGIDSLARVELLFRIEKWFGVALSTQGYAEAETPRDLLNLIGSAERQPRTASQPLISLPETETALPYPAEAITLTQVLKWHCEQQPERTHLLLYEDDEQVTPISYAELYQEAQGIAGGLLHIGLQPGQTAAIMLPTSRDYFISFFAILLCGAIPVPIYPPARLSQIEDHLRRHARILDNARARVMITTQEIVPLARLLKAQTGALQSVVTTQMLMGAANSPVSMKINPGDIAFLQYTSGSTGQPKGVKLSHFNLLANIRAMGEAIRVGPQDVFVSWLPLYHDMGLIGAWLGSLYHGIPLVVMSPLLFLSRPYRWLKVIQQYGGTLSAAPNFAYELCLSKVDDSSIEGLDLSSWRMAFNGAEPVSPNTIRRFTQRFAPYGFRAEAMAPVYGLAESAVGLAFPPPGRLPPIDRLQRAALDRDGSAMPAADSDPDALEVVACGQPLRGHQVRIVDDLGRELPERRVGYLQFQGPSATSGYLHNPQATEKLFNGPWLDSGDLAYIAAGDIYLTSRAKEIIIRAGRNIYPHELEEAVGDIEGVRKGCVAVFGSKDPKYGTERLIVVAETRATDSAIHQQLREKIVAVSVDLTGLAADEVRLVGPHAVLKTSSGKIRRAATRDRYEEGLLDQQQRALWKQFTRLLLAGLGPEWHRLQQALRGQAYAAYAWGLFGLMAPMVWLVVAILPKLAWRWSLIKGSARLIVRLAGVRLVVQGKENLAQAGSAILVANHASYLDGLLLVAALPGRFRIVAKKELRSKLIPCIFLQRIGAFFVERFDPQRGQEDFQQINLAATGGDPLLFFSEGTFSRSPGLLPFRMGAFAVAIDNALPVVPIALRGSRSLLRAKSWFPRRVMISIVVAAPIHGRGHDWEAKLRLRNQVRGEILKHAGEPDLSAEISPA